MKLLQLKATPKSLRELADREAGVDNVESATALRWAADDIEALLRERQQMIMKLKGME